MNETDFFSQLEWEMGHGIDEAEDPRKSGMWCDGFVPIWKFLAEVPPRIVGHAWIGVTGGRQERWPFELLPDPSAIEGDTVDWDRLSKGLDGAPWLRIDFDQRTLEINLRADRVTRDPHTAFTLGLSQLQASREMRERAYTWMRRVHSWGLLAAVEPHLQVEAGKAARGEVEDYVAEIVLHASAAFEKLAWVIRSVVDGARQFENVPEHPTAYEKIVLGRVGEWLDALRAGEPKLHPMAFAMVAGAGGAAVRLGDAACASATEAAARLGVSLYGGIVGPDAEPFAWMGHTVGPARRPRPQQGRPKPEAAGELENDDRAILRAMLDGASAGKAIAAASVRSLGGAGVSYGHVRKRLKDLRAWGLVEPGAHRLTPLGADWARRATGAEGPPS
ncbi:MAG: hypothetical protein AB7O97_07650 [Planctomycetota bacterium]